MNFQQQSAGLMRQNRGKAHGFTLIELMAVIIILGVLAATALPRFIDLSDAAHEANLASFAGALGSATGMVHAKAIVDDELSGAIGTSIDYGGETVQVRFGYPRAVWTASIQRILHLGATAIATPSGSQCVGSNFCGAGNIPVAGFPYVPLASGRVVVIWPEGYFVSDECFVYYNNPNIGDAPNIGVVSSGC